jgi:phosphate transport system protein
MSAVDPEFAAPPALADRVAMVRAQLAPIESRRALLDSYRRESLYRLATTPVASGSAAEVLDLAYAMRWRELEVASPNAEPLADNGMLARQGRPRMWSVAITPHSDRRLAQPVNGSSVQDSDRFVAHGHRDVFDRELLQVREGVVRMGELVATAIDAAIDALARQDLDAAAAVVVNDRAINDAQTDLTALIVTTIATQSPVAGDLRFVLALAHVTYELERIGDHAAGVAKQVAKLGDARNVAGAGLDRMAELASTILHGVLRALVDLDVDAARRVAAQDDEIDRLYHAYFERSLERMRVEPTWVDVGAHLLFAAKDLERIGDRVTNIAEEVVFLATGEVEDLNA